MISILLPYFERLSYLEATLDSFNWFYRTLKDIEVVIVDDGSKDEQRVEGLLSKYPKLNIKLVRLDNKNGINPCLPYNVAARNASGDILILSSPETIHTRSVFSLTKFDEMGADDYYCLSVFCPTDQWMNQLWLDPKMDVSLKLAGLAGMNPRQTFTEYLGMWGKDSFANRWGSWYLHSQHRPSALNFCSAIRKDKFVSLGGFDQRFRSGTGFDDNEFRDRLLSSGAQIKYFDDFYALHLNHPPVYGKGDPVSNQQLFDKIKNGSEPAYGFNDDWGKM